MSAIVRWQQLRVDACAKLRCRHGLMLDAIQKPELF